MVTKLSLLQKRNPMNTETQPTPTAAELLAEWKRLQLIDPDYGHLPNGEAHLQNSIDDMLMTNIAAQLDKMCEDAGIMLIDGAFTYHWESLAISTNGVRKGIQAYTVTTNRLKAKEQQTLQEWLLIKAQAQ